MRIQGPHWGPPIELTHPRIVQQHLGCCYRLGKEYWLEAWLHDTSVIVCGTTCCSRHMYSVVYFNRGQVAVTATVLQMSPTWQPDRVM